MLPGMYNEGDDTIVAVFFGAGRSDEASESVVVGKQKIGDNAGFFPENGFDMDDFYLTRMTARRVEDSVGFLREADIEQFRQTHTI